MFFCWRFSTNQEVTWVTLVSYFFVQPHVLRMYLGYFGFLAHANFDKRNVAFETQGCPGILPKPSAACVLHSQRLVCLAC